MKKLKKCTINFLRNKDYMGMNTSVYGLSDLSEEFEKMLSVKLACDKAGVTYPNELKNFFKYPSENETFLKEQCRKVNISNAVTESGKDSLDAWEVDLSKLPKTVKFIRFENSY
jgi:hypothetical protein